MRSVHRLAWEDAHGPIPDGLRVLHHCDNPPCYNVAHLFLGTDGDNAKDRDRKGRRVAPRGEECGGAVLSELDVAKIIQFYGTGDFTQAALAEIFHVGQSQISNILRGENR